jgi:hypothetical protein
VTKTSCLVLLCCAGWALTAPAGPLPREQTPASAKWLMHLDIERFAPSQTCALLMADQNRNGRLQQQLAVYRQMLGIDPLKDLKHLTLYGEQLAGNRGAALLSGSLNSNTILARLRSHSGYATRKLGSRTIHTWPGPDAGAEMCACFFARDLLVVASDEAMLRGALDVLNGKAASLATGKSALPVPAGAGAFFLAALEGYTDAGNEPVKAFLLKNTKTATVEIGEAKGTVNGRLVLVAPSVEAAGQIEQILNGLVVSAGLASDQSGLAKLAEMSRISSEGKSVALALSCPAQDAAKVLEKTLLPAERAAPRPAAK